MYGIASLSLAVAMVGAVGCTSMKRAAQGDPHRTAGQVKDDKKIKSQLDKALVDAPVYKYPNVTPSVFQGEVALSGFVMTQPQKEAAVRIAQSIPGVTRVNDQLVLADHPGYPVVGQALPGERPHDNPDKRLQAEIERALANAPVYKYPNVTVNVFQGEVALNGFVMTEPQKEEAVRIAKGIQGVSKVNDQLIISEYPVVGRTAPAEQPQNQPDE
jgi:osmotically-inducible protein OsmY